MSRVLIIQYFLNGEIFLLSLLCGENFPENRIKIKIFFVNCKSSIEGPPFVNLNL